MSGHKKIAIGGISTECSTYSPLFQTEDDFNKIEGDSLVELLNFPFESFNIHAHPLFFCKSLPGGPVEAKFFSSIKEKFLKLLKSACPLEGVLLLIHGAMHVPDIEDPEGNWISEVRSIVGDSCIIAVCFDLHGNVTDEIINNINIFTAYRTAPHIDIESTYHRAAKLLTDAVNGDFRPEVVWSSIPVLVSGEMSSTFAEPCRSIYKQLEIFDQRKGVLDSNLMIGYVWADIKTAGASAVVTCSDQQSGIEACTEIAYMYWNNRNKLNFDMHAGEVDKVLKLIPEEFSIVADSGDNPTAGGVGDRADVLEALIKRGIQKVLVAGIAAPGIIKELQTNGHKLISIGNRLGGGGPIIKIKPEKNYIENECAVVIFQGITIVLTEQRRPFHNLRDFTDLGIDLGDFTLLVVKSGYLSPELQSLSAPSYLVLTDGAVCQHFDRLENKFRKRPLFPFENPEEFVPFVSHKQLLSIS